MKLDINKKYYLSGKIGNAGDKQSNIDKFIITALHLRNEGYTIISPIELCDDQDSKTWEDYMKRDIQEMLNCDGIILMQNWTSSPGARLELYIAATLGLDVVTIT